MEVLVVTPDGIKTWYSLFNCHGCHLENSNVDSHSTGLVIIFKFALQLGEYHKIAASSLLAAGAMHEMLEARLPGISHTYVSGHVLAFQFIRLKTSSKLLERTTSKHVNQGFSRERKREGERWWDAPSSGFTWHFSITLPIWIRFSLSLGRLLTFKLKLHLQNVPTAGKPDCQF